MVFSVALIGVAAGGAQGQEPLWPETVVTRERPELDPLGMHAGGFLIFPALALEELYEDNIFAVNTGLMLIWRQHHDNIRAFNGFGRIFDGQAGSRDFLAGRTIRF